MEKVKIIEKKLDKYTLQIITDFDANFHHFKIKNITEGEFTEALKIFILKDKISLQTSENNKYEIKKELSPELLKIISVSFILIYLTICLALIGFSFTPVLFIDLGVFLVICFAWWRDLLYRISKIKVLKDKNIKIIKPFKNIDFYSFRSIPDSIFLHVDQNLLINLKVCNLFQAHPPFYLTPDKFFRILVNRKIPFTYNFTGSPLKFERFNAEGFNYLNEKQKWNIHKIHTSLEGEEWLKIRGGVWKTILNVSTSSYKFIHKFRNRDIDELEEDVQLKLKIIKNSFETYFPNLYLDVLRREKLNSALKMLALKSKFFRLNGTHLNYVLFQGMTLTLINKVPDDLKKGIKTKLATEFNSPLELNNEILIGETINTEYWGKEIPSGFTFKQLHNLLLANGEENKKIELVTKIAMELIKANKPLILFDLKGKMSKIIRYFKDSIYEDDILYFKLGSAFKINLLDSEVPFDKNPSEYLNYIFDVLGLAFRRTEREIESFRNTLTRNSEMDLETLDLELQNQQPWERNPIVDSIMAIINQYTKQTMSFLNFQKNADIIGIKDFIDDDKTVIIDLSILKRNEKMQLFAMFAIISKIIHYSENVQNFCKKILFIPHLDIFFNVRHLDREVNTGLIDKFFDPLQECGFGLICSVRHIRDVHPNVYNFLKNIITFKATHNVDISIIKNLFSLQELTGKGIYSGARKHEHQMHYLMNLKPNEVIIKRSDVLQAYPNKLDLKDVKENEPLDYDEIVDYMHKQGYDLEYTEKKLVEQAKKTIFEKDLGKYFNLFNEINKFLKSIKKVDKIGNIFKHKLQKELLAVITPKVKRLGYKKNKIPKIRNEILEILIKHGYLEENHPRMAGGGESLSPSYSVGSKYEAAIDDYFKVKKDIDTEFNISKTPKEDIMKNIFGKTKDKKPVNDKKFRENLKDLLSNRLIYSLFEMYDLISSNKFKEVIILGKGFIREFLIELYIEEGGSNFSDSNLEKAVNYITNIEGFLYSKKQLYELIKANEIIDPKLKDEENARELYNTLSQFEAKLNLLIESPANKEKEKVESISR